MTAHLIHPAGQNLSLSSHHRSIPFHSVQIGQQTTFNTTLRPSHNMRTVMGISPDRVLLISHLYAKVEEPKRNLCKLNELK